VIRSENLAGSNDRHFTAVVTFSREIWNSGIGGRWGRSRGKFCAGFYCGGKYVEFFSRRLIGVIVLHAVKSLCIMALVTFVRFCMFVYVAVLQLEDDPHNTIAFHVIGEFLYGHTAEDVSL